jgi:ATP-dependent protease ClpP protease subunit
MDPRLALYRGCGGERRLRAALRDVQDGQPTRGWARIVAAAESTPAEVFIYDFIDPLGITAAGFIAELRAIDADEIVVHLNSPGGYVGDGLAIYQALKAHPAKIITRIEGITASIASVIAMAGERVLMAEHAHLMIHDASGLVIGTAADMHKTALVLDQLSDNIASIYAQKADSGGRHDQQVAKWRAKMRTETWFTDREALDAGLIDAVDTGKPAAKAAFDLDDFPFVNVPATLRDVEPSAAPPVPQPVDDTAALEQFRDSLRALRVA